MVFFLFYYGIMLENKGVANMTDKEVSFRSIIFLIIGILLLLSLIICIYIVNGDKDLVKISATVVDVKQDDDKSKNDVTVSYMVDNTFYNYNFTYKDNIKVGDTIDVYYHSKNVTSVQSFKTSKLIFVCPIIGLVLCIIGLFELFRKPKEYYEDDDYKTKIISVVGNTEQLKILADDIQEISYVKSEDEENEVSVKAINKDTSNFKDDEKIEIQTRSTKVDNTANIDIKEIDIIGDTSEKINEVTAPVPVINEKPVKNESISSEKEIEKVDKLKEEKIENEKHEDVENVNKTSELKKSLNSNDNKEIKKEIVKILPKKYYIVGTTLVCELVGNSTKEINFEDIKSIVKTINSEGKLVKLTVCSDDAKCLLTNMYKVSLDQVANTIHNKLLTIKPELKEEIEHKEY